MKAVSFYNIKHNICARFEEYYQPHNGVTVDYCEFNECIPLYTKCCGKNCVHWQLLKDVKEQK